MKRLKKPWLLLMVLIAVLALSVNVSAAPPPMEHQHGNGEFSKYIPPTCLSKGYHSSYVCSCGELFLDKACTRPVESMYVPKIDHQGEFLYTDEYHVLYCHLCDEYLTAEEPHDLVGGVCSTCDYSVCDHLYNVERNVDYHYAKCENCNHTFPYGENGGEHIFVNGVCSECGYGLTHDHEMDYFCDRTYHWWECECGLFLDMSKHNIGYDQTCRDCGYNYFTFNPFTDVDSTQYYRDPILWAYQNDITSGTTDATFEPKGECRREHVVTFLWRAFGCEEPQPNTVNPFVDVKESDYFYKAVLWAYERGITVGNNSPETFDPKGKCIRSQIVTFMWRAVGEPEVWGNLKFTDVPPTAWFYEPVLWAVDEGITYGKTETKFAPMDTCTRGQVVTFLYRLLGPKG